MKRLRKFEIFAEASKGDDLRSSVDVAMDRSKVNLIKIRNVCSISEVLNVRTDRALAGFTFDGENRLFVFEHDEVDFASIDITKKSKLHSVPV